MTPAPENPPAFPYAFHFPDADGEPQGINLGMTLRDYFAGQALCGWLASFGEITPHPAHKPEAIAALCNQSYEVADAMLKARETK